MERKHQERGHVKMSRDTERQEHATVMTETAVLCRGSIGARGVEIIWQKFSVLWALPRGAGDGTH
jgi:hypothetical protein